MISSDTCFSFTGDEGTADLMDMCNICFGFTEGDNEGDAYLVGINNICFGFKVMKT